jgi:uncharacterized protein
MRFNALFRAFLCGFVCVFATALAQAQDSCPPAAPSLQDLQARALRAEVRDRGFLWRLTRGGRTSWLYGTVHASRPDWVRPGPRVQAALAASEVLALELDPSDPELMRAFSAPADPARVARVTAGLGRRIEDVAARECVSAAALAHLQPVLQVATLSLQETRRDGFHPELAIDIVLWGLARGEGKEVVALETPASQLAALLPESEAEEHALLDDSLREIETAEGRATLRRLLQAWGDSDTPELANYASWCQCLDTPQERRYMQRLNDERNGPMADKLAALDASGRHFFAAVGALHMTGAQALPVLLRERGFQVEPIALSSRSTAR